MPETSMPGEEAGCPVCAQRWLSGAPPASAAAASRRRVVRSGIMSRPEIWSWQCIRTHCPLGSIPGGGNISLGTAECPACLLPLPEHRVDGRRGGLAVSHDIAAEVDGFGPAVAHCQLRQQCDSPVLETQGSSLSLGSSARTSCSQPTMMPLGLMSCTCVVG